MCAHNCKLWLYCLVCSMKMVQTNRHVVRISRSTSTAPAFNFSFHTLFFLVFDSLLSPMAVVFPRHCFSLPIQCCAFCLPTLCIVFHLDDKRNFYVNKSGWRFVVYSTRRPFHSHIAQSTALPSTFQSIDWIENLILGTSRMPTEVNLW